MAYTPPQFPGGAQPGPQKKPAMPQKQELTGSRQQALSMNTSTAIPNMQDLRAGRNQRAPSAGSSMDQFSKMNADSYWNSDAGKERKEMLDYTQGTDYEKNLFEDMFAGIEERRQGAMDDASRMALAKQRAADSMNVMSGGRMGGNYMASARQAQMSGEALKARTDLEYQNQMQQARLQKLNNFMRRYEQWINRQWAVEDRDLARQDKVAEAEGLGEAGASQRVEDYFQRQLAETNMGKWGPEYQSAARKVIEDEFNRSGRLLTEAEVNKRLSEQGYDLSAINQAARNNKSGADFGAGGPQNASYDGAWGTAEGAVDNTSNMLLNMYNSDPEKYSYLEATLRQMGLLK